MSESVFDVVEILENVDGEYCGSNIGYYAWGHKSKHDFLENCKATYDSDDRLDNIDKDHVSHVWMTEIHEEGNSYWAYSDKPMHPDDGKPITFIDFRD